MRYSMGKMVSSSTSTTRRAVPAHERAEGPWRAHIHSLFYLARIYDTLVQKRLLTAWTAHSILTASWNSGLGNWERVRGGRLNSPLRGLAVAPWLLISWRRRANAPSFRSGAAGPRPRGQSETAARAGGG